MSVPDNVVNFFDSSFSTGPFYGRQKKREFKAIWDLSEKHHFDLKQADKVLDIGYHSPLELYQIKNRHNRSQIVGVDVTPKKNKRVAKEFKEVATLSIMTGDINHLNFEKGYFDVIYCLRMLNLVSDLSNFLSQCLVTLKKNGYLILSLDHTDRLIPNYLEKYQKNQINTTAYSADQVLASMQKAGFQNQFTKSIKNELEIVIGSKRK